MLQDQPVGNLRRDPLMIDLTPGDAARRARLDHPRDERKQHEDGDEDDQDLHPTLLPAHACVHADPTRHCADSAQSAVRDALDAALEAAWQARARWPEIGDRAADAIRRLVPRDPATIGIDDPVRFAAVVRAGPALG